MVARAFAVALSGAEKALDRLQEDDQYVDDLQREIVS
jgi:hypothetical protein